MEEYTPDSQPESQNETQNESSSEKNLEVKQWFQDNLRIIISAIIVMIIAGGIYSYSNRGVIAPTVSTSNDTPQVSEEIQTNTDGSKIETKQVADKVADDKTQIKNPAQSISQETENSFVQTAGQGDSLTTLARQATVNYLEKNPDSSLTKEHKIYIEDYLRKNIEQKGSVHIGSSVEFSKDLIQKAIAQSKTLNEKQLKNLQQYSARVSSI